MESLSRFRNDSLEVSNMLRTSVRHKGVAELSIPALSEFGLDLLRVPAWRRLLSLAMPFVCVGAYFVFTLLGHYAMAVLSVVYLSFITYGSTSHDLVHRNLGLSAKTNDVFLCLIELLAMRSGHAYQLAHLHHHARFPDDDDIEGAASKMSLGRTLLEGVVFQFRIYSWALRHRSRKRAWVIAEGIGVSMLVMAALASLPFTAAPLCYVVLLIMGSWIIPLITAHIPHDPEAARALDQTRLFRGVVASVVAMEHLYHLEHHLFPAVPHHNWSALARRLDPYFREAGVLPIKLWF